MIAKKNILAFSGLLFFVIILGGVFSVDQRQYAVIFQFGEAVRVIDKPGLNFKIPFIQNSEYFDKRVLTVDADTKELTASDEKRIIVNAFAKYRIVNPVQFYKTVANAAGVKIRLNRILESSMRRIIGKFPLLTLLTVERENITLQIRDAVNEEAKNFGIKVINVGIVRADLPEENSNAIYQRMTTERDKEAKQIRAEGQEEASRIRSQADKEGKVLLGEAYKKSQIIKGEGDMEAARIYNSAYSKDPDFYSFFKEITTYKSVFKKEDTYFILNPNEIFKHLKLNK